MMQELLLLDDIENILNGEIVIPVERADSEQKYVVKMEGNSGSQVTC